MNLDHELIKAVKESVKEAGQPDAVASRILKWLDGLSKGQLTNEDQDSFLDRTYSALKSEHTRGDLDED